jgi:tRNA(Ile2) C34 agmatinyltransferase TiaS
MASREMTETEQKYLISKVGNDPTIAAFLNNQVNQDQSFMQQATRLYICDRCESGALAHGTGYRCVHCGYESKTRSLRIRDYLKGGFHR